MVMAIPETILLLVSALAQSWAAKHATFCSSPIVNALSVQRSNYIYKLSNLL